MTNYSTYLKLQLELEAIEKEYNVYLYDQGIDHENVGLNESNVDYWTRMIEAACNAAGYRASEVGLNINDLIGRNIY
jgi:hypothetical protein